MSDTNEVNKAPEVPVETQAEAIAPAPEPTARRGRPPKTPEMQVVIEDAPLIKVTASEVHLSPQTLLEIDAGRRALGRS